MKTFRNRMKDAREVERQALCGMERALRKAATAKSADLFRYFIDELGVNLVRMVAVRHAIGLIHANEEARIVAGDPAKRRARRKPRSTIA